MRFPRLLSGIAAVAVVVLGWSAVAAPASVIFHCLSVKIEPATLNALGEHRLSFNYSNSATENGELGLVDEAESPGSLRGSGFILTAPGFGVPIEGNIYLDPPQTDANRNGVDDIFEVALALPVASTSGLLVFTTLDDEIVNGTIVAQWQRAAGSTRGAVQIAIVFPGYNRTFQHPFEIYEYTGTMDYVRQGTNVAATVNLTRQGAAGTLAGPWNLQVYDADSLDQLGGAWVAGRPTIKFDPTITDEEGTAYDFIRGGLSTNYFGIFVYGEGSPVDDIPLDYAYWFMTMFDPNDADGDRLPDLTDPDFTGITPPAVRPEISINLEAGAPRLRLTGTPGANYVVEHLDALSSTSWIPVSTNQPTLGGVVDVPLSTKNSNGVRFWRARVQ